MGFVEVVLNLKTVLNNLKFAKKDILEFQPDTLILIDYPGMNLRIAKWAKKHNIKIVYYIAPQVWAWHQSRVYTIKKVVDKLVAILPFEKDFFAKFGVDALYAGHPLIQELNDLSIQPIEKYLNTQAIAILPGSRKQEIVKIFPEQLSIVEEYPEYTFVVAGRTQNKKLIEKVLNRHFNGKIPKNLSVEFDKTREVLKSAKFGLIKSGTATLEAALLNLPQIVCYKTSFISYIIARLVAKVKYISLPNLIMDEEIVTELIQQNLNKDRLLQEMHSLIADDGLAIKNNYSKLKEKLKCDNDTNAEIAEMIAKL
jgi:lipid-A-disaccharide synthase